MGEKFVGSPIAVGLGRIYIEFGEFKAGRLVSQGLVLLVGGLTVFAIYAGFQESQEIDASNRLLVSVERRVASVDPGIYEGYAGMYKLEPRFNIEITYSRATRDRRCSPRWAVTRPPPRRFSVSQVPVQILPGRFS